MGCNETQSSTLGLESTKYQDTIRIEENNSISYSQYLVYLK